MSEHTMGQERYQSCIEACNACVNSCDRCATACLQDDDVEMMVLCILEDLDCAAVCRMAAGYMARDSRYARNVCDLCASICETCAEECARHPQPHCQICAQACRRCADECRRMVSTVRAPPSMAAR